MYHRAFPRCVVPGSVEPVPFKHMGQEGAVPEKCSKCQFMFEGECLRAVDQVKGFLALDHGPCPVKGETSPVLFDNRYFQSKVSVPAKCGSCSFLNISVHEGFTCTFEQEKWGAHPRELDWGDWSPEHPNLGFGNGRYASPELLQAVIDKNVMAGIKAYRLLFPDASIRDARDAFAELALQLDNSGT